MQATWRSPKRMARRRGRMTSMMRNREWRCPCCLPWEYRKVWKRLGNAALRTQAKYR